MIPMSSKSELAPAKLTLSLAITGVSPSGMHYIESEMVTVSLFDEVRLTPSPLALISDPTGVVHEYGRTLGPIPTDSGNIAMRALRLAGGAGGVSIEKRIPPGAGLGGGSADAAAVLRLLGKADNLALALSLGSDVPFCLRGGRAIVRGVGESIEERVFVPEHFVLCVLPFGLSTSQVYAAYDELGGEGTNELERAAFTVSPKLLECYRELSSIFSLKPTMAGSGSTLCYRSSLAALGLVHAEGAAWAEMELARAGVRVRLIEVTSTAPIGK